MLAFSRSSKTYCFLVILTLIPYVTMVPTCTSCKRFQKQGNQVFKNRRSMAEMEPQSGSPSEDIPKSSRSRCCPYDFDPKFCRIVDDRRLCGYNKNIGTPKGKDSIEQLSGGCRLRGGRIECGYQQGPFTNPRRPPVWEDSISVSSNVGAARPAPETVDHHYINDRLPLKSSDSTARPSRATRCMETADNRIVCRDI